MKDEVLLLSLAARIVWKPGADSVNHDVQHELFQDLG